MTDKYEHGTTRGLIYLLGGAIGLNFAVAGLADSERHKELMEKQCNNIEWIVEDVVGNSEPETFYNATNGDRVYSKVDGKSIEFQYMHK